MLTFKAVLFIITSNWKQPRAKTSVKQMIVKKKKKKKNKHCYIYTMEYYLAMKRTYFIHTTIWMNHKCILRSERSQI